MSEPALDFKLLEQIPSCLEVGMQAAKKGSFQTARRMFQAAQRQSGSNAQEPSQEVGLAMHTGDTYYEEGRLNQAYLWYRRAHTISQSLSGPNTMQAACLLSKMAEIHVRQSQMQEFANLFDEILHAYLLSVEGDTSFLLEVLVDLSWTLCVHQRAGEARRINELIAQIKLEEAESRIQQ